MSKVRALKSFGYAGDPEVRASIRRFHSQRKNEGVSYGGDRGPVVEVVAGVEFDAPGDMLDGWLDDKLVEVV